MGTNRTNNNLHNNLGGYENISVAIDLAITNWNMIKIIDMEIKKENGNADWMDALIVAMDFLRTSSSARKYTSLKIILFTTFATSVNCENVDVVIKGLRDLEIELVVM